MALSYTPDSLETRSWLPSSRLPASHSSFPITSKLLCCTWGLTAHLFNHTIPQVTSEVSKGNAAGKPHLTPEQSHYSSTPTPKVVPLIPVSEHHEEGSKAPPSIPASLKQHGLPSYPCTKYHYSPSSTAPISVGLLKVCYLNMPSLSGYPITTRHCQSSFVARAPLVSHHLYSIYYINPDSTYTAYIHSQISHFSLHFTAHTPFVSLHQISHFTSHSLAPQRSPISGYNSTPPSCIPK